jgi:hypothetical protein
MSSFAEEIYQQLLVLGLSEEDLQIIIESRLKGCGGFISQQLIFFIIAKENGINPYTEQ